MHPTWTMKPHTKTVAEGDGWTRKRHKPLCLKPITLQDFPFLAALDTNFSAASSRTGAAVPLPLSPAVPAPRTGSTGSLFGEETVPICCRQEVPVASLTKNSLGAVRAAVGIKWWGAGCKVLGGGAGGIMGEVLSNLLNTNFCGRTLLKRESSPPLLLFFFFF
uniref:Uncharacterized protein n=1 Tax=Sphaerodactylus townsendi TaxID=933632 RepID=A0ACB8G7H9_9SAUR